jgi:hypothetical protein
VPTTPVLDERLLEITDRNADAELHLRTLTVAPGIDRSSVSVKIAYGASLSWPISANLAGWKCTVSTRTCIADNPADRLRCTPTSKYRKVVPRPTGRTS